MNKNNTKRAGLITAVLGLFAIAAIAFAQSINKPALAVGDLTAEGTFRAESTVTVLSNAVPVSGITTNLAVANVTNGESNQLQIVNGIIVGAPGL